MEKARKRRVLYRLEINYYSVDYDDRALETSSPIYSKREGLQEYKKALGEKCVDRLDVPARVHFWKYNYDAEGRFFPVTIAKNY